MSVNGDGRSMSQGVKVILISVLTGGVVIVAGGLVLTWLLPQSRGSHPQIVHLLMTLGNVQEDYHDRDRDGNGIKDYWRGDLVGLHTFYDEILPEEEEPFSVRHYLATASMSDDQPSKPVQRKNEHPWTGYWLRTIRFEGEPPLELSRFAIYAFPENYAESLGYSFILTHEKQIYADMERPASNVIKSPFVSVQ